MADRVAAPRMARRPRPTRLIRSLVQLAVRRGEHVRPGQVRDGTDVVHPFRVARMLQGPCAELRIDRVSHRRYAPLPVYSFWQMQSVTLAVREEEASFGFA